MEKHTTSISNSDKLSLLSSLSTMLVAGIPLVETVDSLLDDAKGGLKKMLTAVRSDLAEGKHLYYAFAKFPNVFDSVTISILKASEESGTLDTALKDIRQNVRKEIEFSDKIRSALTYPLVIFVVFLIVLIVMLVFVVPRISQVFLRMNVALPLPTRVMLFASDIMLHYTIPFLAVGVVIVGAFIYLYKRSKKKVIQFFAGLPVFSPLAREIDLERFSRSLYQLLNAGIPITEALDLAKDVVIKKEIAETIERSKDLVASGRKLSEGFVEHKHIIPNMMIKIIESGEKSATLDKSMLEISEFLDYQVSKRLATLTTLLEPIMLVFVGLLVGGMMMAIIAPIYGLISQVGSK